MQKEMSMNPQKIIDFYYPEETPLKKLLLLHSRQVRDKALQILANPVAQALGLDADLVANGALLHDIGIGRCHAPGILCNGTQPYLAHGILGAQMLREYASQHGLDLEPYARICERHTGTGITAQEIRQQHLPLPEQDFLPETYEEKLICLADKFFSKSGNLQEKPLSRIRGAMLPFGEDTVQRFDQFCALFGVKERD